MWKGSGDDGIGDNGGDDGCAVVHSAGVKEEEVEKGWKLYKTALRGSNRAA